MKPNLSSKRQRFYFSPATSESRSRQTRLPPKCLRERYSPPSDTSNIRRYNKLHKKWEEPVPGWWFRWSPASSSLFDSSWWPTDSRSTVEARDTIDTPIVAAENNRRRASSLTIQFINYPKNINKSLSSKTFILPGALEVLQFLKQICPTYRVYQQTILQA